MAKTCPVCGTVLASERCDSCGACKTHIRWHDGIPTELKSVPLFEHDTIYIVYAIIATTLLVIVAQYLMNLA